MPTYDQAREQAHGPEGCKVSASRKAPTSRGMTTRLGLCPGVARSDDPSRGRVLAHGSQVSGVTLVTCGSHAGELDRGGLADPPGRSGQRAGELFGPSGPQG